MNSSPPWRANRSVRRACCWQSWLNRRSTSSPTWWPWRSLMPLKWSRSSSARQSGECCRRARCSSCSARSSKARRLSAPVKGSVVARCSSCCSRALRWLTSRISTSRCCESSRAAMASSAGKLPPSPRRAWRSWGRPSARCSNWCSNGASPSSSSFARGWPSSWSRRRAKSCSSIGLASRMRPSSTTSMPAFATPIRRSKRCALAWASWAWRWLSRRMRRMVISARPTRAMTQSGMPKLYGSR
ncbi:hypothetical protein D9M69_540230 [compost metagenome]